MLRREAIIPLRRPRGAFAWIALGAIASVLMSCAFVALVWLPGLDRAATRAFAPASDHPVAAADDAIGTAVDARALEPRGPGRVRNVVASHGPFGVIAVHTDDTVLASFDDGRSFTQVLGAHGAVDGVAVDGTGAVYAIRNRTLLGVARAAGDQRWHELPYAAETFALTATGRWVAWLHDRPDHEDTRDDALHPVLAITRDGGASFEHLVAPHAGNTGNHLRLEADGTIHLLTIDQTDADRETVRRFRGHVDGRAFAELAWDEYDVGALGQAYDGRIYAAGCRGHASHLCAIDQGPAVVVTDIGSLELAVGSNQADATLPRTVAIADGAMHAVYGDRVGKELWPAPPAVHAAAVDDLGRVLALSGDRLLRWSGRHGWARLDLGAF